MYIAIDLNNNTANGFKDLTGAAEQINVSYSTLKRHFDRFGHYKKDNKAVFKGKYIKSNRGNPNFGRL